ncbi:MAG: DUF2071 domain-containing protein [Nitrospinaceae bacterium]|nr:DUF2071 domain-containing protein [Nitrospinaceae bacterium]NIR53214.1 DUF2071 domain-containing protein [Nitrospinaceae bacterium]NIS83609.1 DUF2071 domain-containing protein [Nitrospinaceae bacterium]NIT80399.1 DUF2071 domain-containing protein [Nitrospinaceae bacterium]NIU42742.1 DUF2071 domain-containing protein [Nitrospinaceae bacterium]
MALELQDLLFLHWPVEPEALIRRIPPPLQLEIWDQRGWLGVVAFRVAGIRWVGCPLRIPGLSFPQVNVRTYVTRNGRPGVWFFSLDVANRPAVWGARLGFHLPCFQSRMSFRKTPQGIYVNARRTHRKAPGASFRAWYRPGAEKPPPNGESRDHWLLERYRLFAANPKGRLFSCEIQHAPWSVHQVEAVVETNTLAEPLGLSIPETEPMLHYSPGLELIAGWPVKIRV